MTFNLTVGLNATDITPTQAKQTFEVSPLMRTIFVCYYSVVFTVAVGGNLLALVACYKNYSVSAAIILSYIASLASADLIFALLSVFDLVFFLHGSWVGGEAVCKIQGYLIETSYTASILTLLAISYERKKAVSTQVLVRSHGTKRRHELLKIIWVMAILACGPLFYAYTVKMEGEKSLCVNTAWGNMGRQVYYTIQAVALFLIPIFIMVWAHVKIFNALRHHIRSTSKTFALESFGSEKRKCAAVDKKKQRKVTKMLFVVTLAFCLCYVPFMCVRTLRYFFFHTGDVAWKFVQLLIFSQTAFNPIIYCFYGRLFKLSLQEVLRCRFDCFATDNERRRRLRGSSSGTVSSPNTDSNTSSIKHAKRGWTTSSLK